MATDYVDQVASAIIRQLKEGTAPWQKPWQPGERFMPYNPTTGNEYHGMNAMWLMSRAEGQGFGDATMDDVSPGAGTGRPCPQGREGYAHPVLEMAGPGAGTRCRTVSRWSIRKASRCARWCVMSGPASGRPWCSTPSRSKAFRRHRYGPCCRSGSATSGPKRS